MQASRRAVFPFWAVSFVYVAEIGETFKASKGESDARLKAIYSNGTESNLLRRSLQRALYKDEAGRRLTDPNPGAAVQRELG